MSCVLGMTLNCIHQSHNDLHLLQSLCRSHFSTIEVFVAIPMTRWKFRIVPCLAGENSSATCLKMLVMRFSKNIL